MNDEINKDNEALQIRLPSTETKIGATIIADMGTNSKDLNIEMYAIMERTTRQSEELEKVIKEQSSRHDIGESESISLSLEDEFLNSALDENKDIMECDQMSLVLEEELQEPTLVEKNELAIDEELSLKEKEVEKKHLELIIEGVLVKVEDFNFPINYLTFGMEEDRLVSFIERSSIAKIQVWIDAQHGEMTLLVGEEKMMFDLHQRTPLMDEEMRSFKKLESSFPLIEEQAPKILQEDTLEGYKFEANSFPTKEFAFELTSPILEVEEVLLTSDEDEEGVLASIDEGPKRRSQTSPMSLICNAPKYTLVVFDMFRVFCKHNLNVS